jgi:hypothetical protein
MPNKESIEIEIAKLIVETLSLEDITRKCTFGHITKKRGRMVITTHHLQRSISPI